MPRLRGRQLDAAEVEIKQPKPRVMKNTGPAEEALTPHVVETVDKMPSNDKLAELAFADEKIEVMVHESTDKNAEDPVEVYNGGIPQRFGRGKRQVVKRKFVEVLARAKQTTYGNQKITMQNGEEAYTYPGHTALRYPFTVYEDANPRGRDWLKKLLAEG